jgi:hypothetical protein
MGTVCMLTEGILVLAETIAIRKLVGEALWRKWEYPKEQRHTWGVLNSAPREVRLAETILEREVSTYIGQMPFLWVGVPDAPSQRQMASVRLRIK